MKIFKTLALSLGVTLNSCTIPLSANDTPDMRRATEDFKHMKRHSPQPCTYPGDRSKPYYCFMMTDQPTGKSFVFYTNFGSPKIVDIRTLPDEVWPEGKVDYATLKALYGAGALGV